MRYLLLIFLYVGLICQINSLAGLEQQWSNPLPYSQLNSAYDDYAPIFNNYDGLLYISSNRDKFHYLYSCTYKDSIYTSPKLINSPINMLNNNQNYICFMSPSLSYITSFIKTPTYPTLNLFKSYFVKNGWSEYILDDTLNIGESNAQLSISPDKLTAVYISTKDNSNNDTDLWMISRNEDGNWTEAIKLDEINSHGREITPYLKSGDSLYFASDGLGGPGGFDIYLTIKNDGIWQRPTPFFQLNSEFNESDLTFLPDGMLLFASDRPGSAGGLDIFYCKPIQLQDEIQSTLETEISIQTQVGIINALIENYTLYFPFPLIIPKEYFTDSTNKLFTSYYKASFDSLFSRMLLNPGSLIQISNSQFADDIKLMFSAKGINSDRIIFSGNTDDFVELSTNNPELFKLIKLSERKITLKPPVLDINLEERNHSKFDSLEFSLLIDSHVFRIDLNHNTLPQRFYYDLEPFNNLIGLNDSLQLSLKYSVNNSQYSIPNKVISINKNESNSIVKIENNLKYVDYYFVFRNTDDLNKFTSFNEELIDLIKLEMEIAKRVTIEYKNPKNEKLILQLISILNNKKKNIEPILVKGNNHNINSYENYIVRMRIEKY